MGNHCVPESESTLLLLLFFAFFVGVFFFGDLAVLDFFFGSSYPSLSDSEDDEASLSLTSLSSDELSI